MRSHDCHVTHMTSNAQGKIGHRKRILSDVDGKSSKAPRVEASRKINEFFRNCGQQSKSVSTQVRG